MAETLVNKNQAGEGIWTADNLVAGSGISIQQVPQPVIDANTVALYHFNNNIKDEISGENATYSADLGIFYAAGKFDNCLYMRRTSDYMVVSPSYNLNNTNSTIDFWFRNNPENTSTSLRLTAFSQFTETAHNPYLIMAFSNYIYLGKYISGTGSTVEASFSGELDFTVWNHIAYVVDATNNKVYLFLNGTKIYDQSITSSLVSEANTWTIVGRYAEYDEVRVSNIARWTSDFTPYTVPYAASAGPTQYAINNTKADPDLSSYLQNTATATNSLTINGVANTASATSVNIGDNSQAVGGQCVAIGAGSTISNSAYANANCVAIGFAARANYFSGTAIGRETEITGTSGVAVGYESVAATNAVAIGKTAKATAQSAIQIGTGTNSTASTFQVFNTTVVNASGKVPIATFDFTSISGYDATKTQVLKNVQGTLTWVDEA
jgi:hypothetical protein